MGGSHARAERREGAITSRALARKEGAMYAYGRRVGARLLALVAVSAAFAFVVAAPASAGTMQVAGVQSAPVTSGPCFDSMAVNPSYTMVGGLVGCWYTDTFNQRGAGQPSGTIQATGTEHFVGCLDLNGDGTCDPGEPSGTLMFTFQFTGKFAPVTIAEIHGRCQHPIVSGTDGFAGASGVITFKDDVVTGTSNYKGHVTL